MEYYIYLNMPEYTQQFVLSHFRDKNDPTAVNVKDWYVIYGFVVDNLQRRSSQNYNPKEEAGKLKLIVPDSKFKRKDTWNYMSSRSKQKLCNMFRMIMFSQFWQYILPVWDAIMFDRCHRRKSQHTIDNYINSFFALHNIDYSEEASNNFKQCFARSRKKLEKDFGIKM